MLNAVSARAIDGYRELPRRLQIGSLSIDGGVAVQAALSGYSDRPMRVVAREHGAPFCFHEVVLDKTVTTPGKLQRRILDLGDEDHPIGGQLMGSDPSGFAPAARTLVDAGFDLVDINFGCPVPRVLGRCRGGFLLGEPETALQIVDSVVQTVAGDAPVTVKMRRGIADDEESERAFWTILEGLFERGASGVTVHPRTVEQRYVGPSRWSFLTRVKQHVGPERTVLGSGDLFSVPDIESMLLQTGVDGVTLARGAIGNPFLFRQWNAHCAGNPVQAPSIGEQRAAIERHAELAHEVYGDKAYLAKTRTHAIKYAALHPSGVAVRDAFVKIRERTAFDLVLETYYAAACADERARDVLAADDEASRLKSCGVAGGDAPDSPPHRES